VARDAFPPAWIRERCSWLQQRGSAALQRAWGAAAPAGSRGLRTIKDASKNTFDRLRATSWRTIARRYKVPLLVLGGVLLAAVLLVIIVEVPQRQVASWRGQPGVDLKDLPKLENDARTTLVQALGGAVLLIGLYFTLRNLQLTQDRQITEHYTRAVEHLGSEKLEVRLGSIYALERIARDSERDHWPIMEILTAYVREHTPWEPEDGEPWEEQGSQDEISRIPPLAIDIQAILTVLGRRTRTYGKGEDQRLDLSYTDLHEVDLCGVNLVEANLSCANFREAVLDGADLRGADLFDSVLRSADWRGAQLQEANLRGADVRAARHLTVEQLSTVKTLLDAQLDPRLQAEIRQQYPYLLERPDYLPELNNL
jgi:hypothetical protein